MTEDVWIAYRSAAVELGGDGPVLRALVTGKIKSQGWRYGRTEPDDLTSDHWATMTFLPTFKGPLSEKMRGLDWLVPRGTELRRVCLASARSAFRVRTWSGLQGRMDTRRGAREKPISLRRS